MTILTTQRCHLSLFSEKDAQALLPILGCPEVMQYSMTGAMDIHTITNTINEWLELYKIHRFCPWGVMYGDQLIGYAGLDIREIESGSQVQITFRLAKKYWGKGLATELAIAIKKYAFNNLNLSEIIAITDPNNKASIRTISKIGMIFDKEIIYGGLRLNLYRLSKV